METTSCCFCDVGNISNSKDVERIPACVRAFPNDSFTVWRCSSCNSLHCKESADLEAYYKVYPFKDHKLDFHTRIAYKNRLKMLLKQGIKKTDSILDYGCGAGVFLDFLREEGFKDLSGYDAYIPKYADTSVLGRKYDVVTSYDVIEHVESPVDYLQNLIKLVQQNGLLVLGTPNADHIPLTSKPPYAIELSQPYHRHIFSEKSLLQLAAKFGLEIKHTYRRFYFDTLIPGVNTRFMWEYINACGGKLETCVEPPNTDVVKRSPKLIFFALFGYFFPSRGNILLTMRKLRDSDSIHKKVAND